MRLGKAKPILFMILFALFFAGCASGPVVVTPERIDIVAVEPESAEKWVLWIDEVKDSRKVPSPDWFGTLDRRFEEENLTVLIKPEPKVYLKENLSKLFLDMGLEASSKDKARILVIVDIQRFEATRDSTGVMDFVSVDLEYVITFKEAGSDAFEFSKVSVNRNRKLPVGGKSTITDLIHETMSASMEAVIGSAPFKNAIKKSGNR